MITYWQEEEKHALKRSKSFEEMVQIATSILKRMPQPVVQICGPMSTGGAGNLEKNMKRFQIAINALNENGISVFDQITFQDAIVSLIKWTPDAPYNMDILEVFYSGIFKSGLVAKAIFLPGWESSKGATWEREFLKSLNVPIEDYPPELFEKVLELENL